MASAPLKYAIYRFDREFTDIHGRVWKKGAMAVVNCDEWEQHLKPDDVSMFWLTENA